MQERKIVNTRPMKRNLFWMFFSFYGRVSRGEYWLAQLSLVAVFVVVIVALNSLGGFDAPEGATEFAALTLFAMVQITWFFGICVAVKRLHDLGWPGGMAVFMFVPILGAVTWIYIGFRKGNPGDNKFGPSPQSRE